MHLAIQVSTRKINNMHFMDLIMLFDFMQVIYIKRNRNTKNEHFSKHIIFSIIY
jgi:hypothetical protein